MGLSTKLAEWEKAEIISAEARARIQEYEAEHRKPVILYGLLGLGAFAIGVGLIAIVAANWSEISDQVKLVVDLVLANALAGATYAAWRRQMPLLTDVLVGVFYAFTLASLSLVGQVYQVGEPLYLTLLTWSVATLPLVLLGHSRWLGLLWCAGLSTTYGSVATHWLDVLHRRELTAELWPFLAGVWVLALFAVARRWLAAHAPLLESGFRAGASTLLVGGGLLTTVTWYSRVGASTQASWGLVLAAAVTLAAWRLLPWLAPDMPRKARHGVVAFMALLLSSLVLSVAFQRAAHDVVGALFQLGLLATLAYVAVQQGRMRAFSVVTAAIAARVVIAYIEVFGSLLDTGLGMVLGGLLTLFLAWLWKRSTKGLERHWGKEAHHGA